MKNQNMIVFYKKGLKRIFLFEANCIDAIFQAFEYDEFKDKREKAYFLVDGVEIKLTDKEEAYFLVDTVDIPKYIPYGIHELEYERQHKYHRALFEKMQDENRRNLKYI